MKTILNALPRSATRMVSMPREPPGIEYLSMVDQLVIDQQIEYLELLSHYETPNKYKVNNIQGQSVYHATEVSNFCLRQCCGPSRPFEMKIFDNLRNEVIHFHRPFACQCCCCPCCLQRIEVSAPPGTVIGSIKQKWSICWPTFAVKNANGNTVLRIKGPCCTCGFCRDVKFKIMNAVGNEEVGNITKKWTDAVRELVTDSDTFSITFPKNLDVKMKAVLLSGVFLIDMMYYETRPGKHNTRNRR